MSVPLPHLEPGAQARIRSLLSPARMRRRLMDLGLVPGTVIHRMMDSPIGDPICFQVRGAMIALRKADASQVIVELQ